MHSTGLWPSHRERCGRLPRMWWTLSQLWIVFVSFLFVFFLLPAAERRSPIDHEHYLQKQVRPVAEPMLALLGLDFDQVIGDRTQLELPF